MNSQYGMVFYPQNACFQNIGSETRNQMLAGLSNEGFLGEFFSIRYEGQKEAQTGYLIGDKFLKLITFLGCSPHLAVSPPEKIADWGNFCHIEIQQYQSPVFFKGLNNSRNSCPQCKSRVAKMLPKMEQWEPDSMHIVCPKCHQTSLAEDLNWRHSAGFGTFFIIIHSVYPHEAVPTEQLLNIFRHASDSFEQWDYFYYER